jgi:FAD binding domain
MPGERPVLIAGGGIGGLAAAVGLARKGFRCVVLEKAAVFGEVGAGIQLGPNAFHAFDYLGVGEAARAIAVAIDQLRLMDAVTAEEITYIDLGETLRSRFRNPYAVVHRGDLQGIFLKACQNHALVEFQTASDRSATVLILLAHVSEVGKSICEAGFACDDQRLFIALRCRRKRASECRWRRAIGDQVQAAER